MRKSKPLPLAALKQNHLDLKETPLPPRFIRVRPDVFDIGLEPADVCVLMLLQDFEYRYPKKAVSLSYIGKKIMRSRWAVGRSIEKLEAIGMIKKLKLPAVESNGKYYRQRRYKVQYQYEPKQPVLKLISNIQEKEQLDVKIKI